MPSMGSRGWPTVPIPRRACGGRAGAGCVGASAVLVISIIALAIFLVPLLFGLLGFLITRRTWVGAAGADWSDACFFAGSNVGAGPRRLCGLIVTD